MVETVLEAFQSSVPEAFAFLREEHGFVIDRDDEYAFTAASTTCEIVVELDWGSIVVSLRPSGTVRSVRLSFIVGAFDPEVLFLPRYPWGPKEAWEEVGRQADLLRRYCGELLRGDFSKWPELEEHQQKVLEQWRTESERLVREARVKLVRRRAESAFQGRRFSEAAQLWGSISEDLEVPERRKLDYARRRLILRAVPKRPRLEDIA